nr:glycoside hydrolase family 38 C-terminal domain-containing protein [Candidatus Sigynarchaeota archaeon]
MARSKIGRVSGSERLDTKNMKEPDKDNEATRKLWLEELPEDPDFQEDVAKNVKKWKDIVSRSMDPSKLDIYMAGESHIDVAWLWRYEQTRKKSAVTLRKAVMHAKMFPGKFNYALSEPILLEWIKEDDPALFEEIKAEVKRGGIELVGGAYVEPDCMMPSGEAFTRQRLYGQMFYRDNFGALPEVEWFLDSFGYNWGLPQILAKSGAKYFWTSKMTWNLITHFPFVYFWWEGPDGTRLKTANFHMGAGGLNDWFLYEYGRRPLKKGGIKVWDYTMDYDDIADNVEENEICPIVGHFSGAGDGGHGPTSQEVATYNEYARTGFMHWGKVHDFFHALDKWYERFPVWKDELYLENHQGTFSVHAEVKRHNRLYENAITAIESLCTIISLVDMKYAFPADKITRVWKTVLKGQFHDVLPGSSIPEVYDDAMDDWDENEEILAQIKAEIGAKLAGKTASKVSPRSVDLLLYNPVSWDRASRVFIPVSIFKKKLDLDAAGKPSWARLQLLGGSKQEVIAQPIAAEDPSGIDPRPAGWWMVVPLKALSVTPAKIMVIEGTVFGTETLKVSTEGIQGKNVSVKLDQNTGAMTELKAGSINDGKNLLAGSVSNLTFAFKDESRSWPAWNLQPEYWKYPIDLPNDKKIKISVDDQGPVFCSISINRMLGESPVTQKITTFDGCPEIFLEWIADWQQINTMLKVRYDTATDATIVIADIAFGAIERSTRPKVACDKARFEKICHKYFDLSTPDKKWGIAMLNEGKYAFDASEGTMRLTMLRSPAYPGPAGEAFVYKERAIRTERYKTAPPKYSGLGPFKCRYALFPHEGGALASADGKPKAIVKQKAEEFNQPVMVIPTENLAPASALGIIDGSPLLEIKPAHVMASTVKPGEWMKNGNVIARFLENSGIAAEVTVTVNPVLAKKVKSVRAVDLIERPIDAKCTWDANKGVLTFKTGKFEACTFELQIM